MNVAHPTERAFQEIDLQRLLADLGLQQLQVRALLALDCGTGKHLRRAVQ